MTKDKRLEGIIQDCRDNQDFHGRVYVYPKDLANKILSSGYVHIDEYDAKIILQVEYNKWTGEELPEDVALGMVQALEKMGDNKKGD